VAFWFHYRIAVEMGRHVVLDVLLEHRVLEDVSVDGLEGFMEIGLFR